MKKHHTTKELPKGEVILYKSQDGSIAIDVKLEGETVWLNPIQMAKLFDKARPTILEHIKNVYNEGEVDRNSTCRKFQQVQFEGERQITRRVDYYNLDVIISVGYRVKSKRGTQFRIWANRVLKEYLLKGYALNERKLKAYSERIKEIERTLEIFSSVTEKYKLQKDEFSGILKVVADYSRALDLLDSYDHQKLKVKQTTKDEKFRINYAKAIKEIDKLRVKFGGSALFAKEKDDSFKGSINAIYQTFDGNDLYPSVEEKAANLLYFVIKNHSFIDGNKRIATSIFLWFLDNNGILYKETGEKRIADNAIVALCLMIAESNPKEKDMMIKVAVNLINKSN